jgi:hypothetical protein
MRDKAATVIHANSNVLINKLVVEPLYKIANSSMGPRTIIIAGSMSKYFRDL